MIKLFTLKDLSAFSSDAVYKICLSLEDFGLTEEETVTFDSYDELYEEAVVALESGEHILIAAENSDYNVVKRDIIGKFLLEEYSEPGIAEVIEMNAGDDVSEIDMTGHTLVPRDSDFHLSPDGLYSGFTSEALMGRVSCIPLDFMRVDTILESLKEDILVPLLAEMNGEMAPIKMPDFDFVPFVSEMVNSLSALDKTIALATSEATMWVYNLYDKVDNFNEVLRFVEVIDENETEETTAESESVRIIRQAREAMSNSGSDFGGAISEIYSTENDEGQTVYFAYAALVDKGAAKAKKINTMNPNDLAAILPHAVTVLTDLVHKKALVLKESAEKENAPAVVAPKADDSKKMSKNMLIFGIAMLAIAIICPIILTISLFGGEDPTTTTPVDYTYDPYVVNGTVNSITTTVPTTDNPFVTNSGTTVDAWGNNSATEPSAQDISNVTTLPSVSSTSGTFTFHVFGYGHGVGMSQQGADYLARQGWSWAEILAHYYYNENTKIVTGDAYPDTISYAGSDYNTRDFLASALEAEMGSGMHKEALKAQTVAIYTFAKYYAFKLSSDACAILGSGQEPSSTCYAVVDEVMELAPYISYGSDGACAMTPFHAMSAGMTTAYYNVWGKEYSADLPYLSGARRSYGDFLESDYSTSFTITSADLKALIKANADIDVSGDPASWLTILSHDGAIDENIGYVSSINVGGKIMTGNDFRIKVMEGRIRSHCFIITYTPD